MRITVLTTQTIHHTFFIYSLLKIGYEVNVFLELNQNNFFPFSTKHEFEQERDIFEKDKFFNGENVLIENLTNTKKFENLNSKNSIEAIKNDISELIIVFGTGLIKKEFINASRGLLLNLHGGDPEKYRGLDSHLWAIYHKDFDSIVTTIHKLDEKLDNGEILIKGKLDINKSTKIESLRSINTQLCINLSQTIIEMYLNKKSLISSNQRYKGRYYSAMPSVLKSVCIKNFKNYIKNLGE